MNFHEALQWAGSQLQGGASAGAEAEQLVLAALRQETGEGKALSRLELFSRARESYPQAAEERLRAMVAERRRGVPLQHLTGFQAFLDHEYEVGPEVLIPRPETEVLALLAIETLRKQRTPPLRGIEIGLGSGILSIELLAAFPALRIRASELTVEAAALAERNAERLLGATRDRLEVLRAPAADDVFGAFAHEEPVDFVISNPPYLVQGTSEVEDDVARHEPATALFAPSAEPLHFYRAIAEQAPRFLRREGWVFLELPHERAGAIAALFGRGWEFALHPDLTGRDRVAIGRWLG